MKTLLALFFAITTAQADTQYYYQNIPGTPLPSASRPAIAVERVYGTTRVYQTRPGTTMQDLSAPSYSTFDPTYIDRFNRDQHDRDRRDDE